MTSKNPPAAAVIERRRARALTLRESGLTYEEIADTLRSDPNIDTPDSFDKARAWKDVDAAMGVIRSEMTETARRVMELELRRLDLLQSAHWQLAMTGNVNATKVILSVMERRAKLLGLDAPTLSKLETTTFAPDAIAAEIERLETELNGNGSSPDEVHGYNL